MKSPSPAPLRLRAGRSTRALSFSAFLVIVAGLIALPLRAHDIYSSWAEAKILTDKLELTLTLARSCAHDLLPDAKKLPAITPETFAELAPKLRAIAPDLLRIAAEGKPLPFVSSQVKINGDADVTFILTYAKPATGPLRFIVEYLGHLVDGHVGTVVVTNAAGDDLGWSPVTMDQPVFQIALPTAAAASAVKPKQ